MSKKAFRKAYSKELALAQRSKKKKTPSEEELQAMLADSLARSSK